MTVRHVRANPIESMLQDYTKKSEIFSQKQELYKDFKAKATSMGQRVEELGKKADGDCAELAIEDVPAGTAYRIDEYDGSERVMTNDSYDWKIAT